MQIGRRVLIGFAESLAAIETAWMLLDAGYEVHAFTRQSRRRPALARSSRIAVHTVRSPQDSAEATVNDVAALVKRVGATAVMPLDDDAIWICDRLSNDSDISIAGPTGERARLALDKRKQLSLARDAGFTVPPTTVLPDDLPSDWGRSTRIVKPALAVSERAGRLVKGSAFTVETADELHARLDASAEPMLLQPMLNGVGEGIFGYARAGEPYACTAHRRIRMMNPAGSGSSACRSIDVDAALLEPTRAFLDTSGWNGLFMVELLRGVDSLWFMELNGRPWGSMALARRRGLNYPAWAVAAAEDAHFTPPVRAPGPHVVARHLGREIVHVGMTFRGPQSVAMPDWPTLGAAIRSVVRWHRDDRLYNYRRGEARVLIADTWQTVAGRASRRLGRR